MLDLLLAMALVQAQPPVPVPNPCHAVPQGRTHRSCPVWRSEGRDGQGEIFSNPASLTRSGTGFEMSFRIVYDADQSGGMRSLVTRHRFDCANRTFIILTLGVYTASGIGAEGRPPAADAPPAPVTPGSPGERFLAEYCPR